MRVSTPRPSLHMDKMERKGGLGDVPRIFSERLGAESPTFSMPVAGNESSLWQPGFEPMTWWPCRTATRFVPRTHDTSPGKSESFTCTRNFYENVCTLFKTPTSQPGLALRRSAFWRAIQARQMSFWPITPAAALAYQRSIEHSSSSLQGDLLDFFVSSGHMAR